MVKELGGSVISATKKAEYGRAPINIDQESDLLSDVEDKSIMWMSHGDSINCLPDGFNKIAHTENTLHAAISNDCLLYTSPSPRDKRQSRMPSSA